jgi:hypothetical protein
MFLIVAVSVVVGIVVGYAAMNMFYGATAPAPDTMMKKKTPLPPRSGGEGSRVGGDQCVFERSEYRFA